MFFGLVVKNSLLTCKTHDVLGHGDHIFTEQVHILVSFLEFPRMIAPDMINDFDSLKYKHRLLNIKFKFK